MPAVGEFEGKPFKSVTRGAADLDAHQARSRRRTRRSRSRRPPGIDNLIALMRLTLKEAVKDVRVSERLTDSAVCLVADEGDMDIHLERLLQQHKQLDARLPRVLEINRTHPMIAALAKRVVERRHRATPSPMPRWLLLDQARIQDGEALADPAAFAKRLGEMLGKAFS